MNFRAFLACLVNSQYFYKNDFDLLIKIVIINTQNCIWISQINSATFIGISSIWVE